MALTCGLVVENARAFRNWIIAEKPRQVEREVIYQRWHHGRCFTIDFGVNATNNPKMNDISIVFGFNPIEIAPRNAKTMIENICKTM